MFVEFAAVGQPSVGQKTNELDERNVVLGAVEYCRSSSISAVFNKYRLLLTLFQTFNIISNYIYLVKYEISITHLLHRQLQLLTGYRRLAVWLSGNALASINVVALRQTRLVPGWVTVCGRVNHIGI